MTTTSDRRPRLAVLLSGGGTTLANLADRIDDGRLDASIALVVASRPDAFGLERARNRGLPHRVVPWQGRSQADAFQAGITEAVDASGADLVVLAGFLRLWRVPERWAGRVLNIHPALLPKFGGRGMYGHHVHEAVLAAGETESGCTVHVATNEYDAGPVVLQRRVPVLPDDTPDSLAARVFEAECEAYPEAIRRHWEALGS